jgi:ATP-dependent phosphofructokinase / diphosphate-dependent phosphofructokinase
MGRDAGWIALSAAIAGGAEVCLIPEIPYDIKKVADRLESRFSKGRGFAIVVIAEGAMPVGGDALSEQSDEVGYGNVRLRGAAIRLEGELKSAGVTAGIRETILGHLQRGGIPVAYDRILATQFGVKAFEMVLEGRYGEMVAYRHPEIVSIPLIDAIQKKKFVTHESDLVKAARGVGISLGD